MSTAGFINVSLETFGGLLSLIFILCLTVARPRKSKIDRYVIHMLVCNTALLFSDATAWLFKARMDPFSRMIVPLANFFVFILGYVILFLFTRYLVQFLESKNATVSRRPHQAMKVIMSIAIMLVVVSQWNHMYYIIDELNIYHRQGGFWLSQVFGFIGLFINGFMLLKNWRSLSKKEITAFAFYVLLPVIALIIQAMFYGIAVLYLATTICLLTIYIGIQMDLVQEMNEKELELERNRTAVTLSQIQPHFLFNALLGIKELCDTHPQKASDALEHFSYYLRGNLDTLSRTDLISFDKECEHVADYLYLEKMRFEERITIRWELGATDFLIPPLTVQPIVENAIRHGILKKSEGGTILIRSEGDEAENRIMIQDDGIGFIPHQTKDDGRSHIGLDNVRSRIEKLCQGTLRIDSKENEGTAVTISLPVKKGVL